MRGLPAGERGGQAGELFARARKLSSEAQRLVALTDEAIHRAVQSVSQVTLRRRARRLAEKLATPPERRGAY